MNLKFYQEPFRVGDLVCYKQNSSRSLCGIITEIKRSSKSMGNGMLAKIFWCINGRSEEVDISPLSFPPVRQNGWVAVELLECVGELFNASREKQKNT